MATKKKIQRRKMSVAKKTATKKPSGSKKSSAAKSKVKAAPRAVAMGPRAVATGKGPSPLDVGQSLVDMVRAGRANDVEEKWWAPGVVSVEGLGVSMEWEGQKAAKAKNAAWEADHVIHSLEVEGPFVGATGFAVRYRIDVTTKSTGQRDRMEEVGIYTVKDGKIVREEFMYRAG
jgi:hypothetical protein